MNAAGIDSRLIPSKIEGIAFGQDVVLDGKSQHTLFIANDNDFLATIADPLKEPGDASRGWAPNPNKFYVFAFADEDLPDYVPERIRQRDAERVCRDDDDRYARDAGRDGR